MPNPPGLNIPDGRRPDDEANTVCNFENVLEGMDIQNGLTALLLLRLARAGPPTPTLEVSLSLQSALAPQKFFNFLCRVRAIRSAKRPIARDERLSHRVSILGGYMLRLRLLLLQWVGPQRHSSWGAEMSRGAVYHSCCWSLDLVP